MYLLYCLLVLFLNQLFILKKISQMEVWKITSSLAWILQYEINLNDYINSELVLDVDNGQLGMLNHWHPAVANYQRLEIFQSYAYFSSEIITIRPWI